LTAFERKFNEFKEINPSLKNISLSSNQQVEARYNELHLEQKTKLLKEFGNQEEAKRSLKQSIDYMLVSNSNEFKQLSPEKKQEFTQMMGEYYRYNESLGLGDELKEIW
jgi:hypothetical protein